MKAVALAVLSLWTACSDTPLLFLQVVTPEGLDPLASADSLRLVVTQPHAETSGPVAADGKFTVELTAKAEGQIGQIVLEGYAGTKLVARGETPPIYLFPTDDALAVLVGRAGELSNIPARLTSPGYGLSVVLIPSLGLLIAGGADAADQPLASASLYDFFTHTLSVTQAMPETRMDAVGANCGGTCGLLVLGSSSSGLAETILVYNGGSWNQVADGLPPSERRRGAGISLLDDGSYLIVGGEGPQGALDSALRLHPTTPSFEVLPARSSAARSRPAVASSGTAVLIVGGQPTGGPAAEVFSSTTGAFQTLVLEGTAPAAGAAVTDLSSGKFVVVGGRDESGNLIRDGWIVDPVLLKATRVANCLAEGRADHQLVRAGGQLLVVGGSTSTGAVSSVEILTPELSRLGQAALTAPRTAFAVGRLGPGAFLVAGGRAAAGAEPTAVLEVFETGVPAS